MGKLWKIFVLVSSEVQWHNMLFFTGHSERAMLYHELEDGMYSVTSYFFAKVNKRHYERASGMTEVFMCRPLGQQSITIKSLLLNVIYKFHIVINSGQIFRFS